MKYAWLFGQTTREFALAELRAQRVDLGRIGDPITAMYLVSRTKGRFNHNFDWRSTPWWQRDVVPLLVGVLHEAGVIANPVGTPKGR